MPKYSFLPALALFLIWSSMSATTLGHTQDDGRAAQLATVARDLAARGEAVQAVALVQAELAPTQEPQARSVLLFTLGWLEHQIADQDRGQRMHHLESAERWYRDGLTLAPDNTPARANLELVQGDIHLERGERDAALASWRRSLDLSPDDPAAGERFLDLIGSDARALATEAHRLEADGHLELAREAWARSLAATPPEAQGEPALRWLLLTAESNEFTRASVDVLPEGGAPLAELRLLATDSLRAPVPSWASSQLGRHAVAEGFRSLATERLGEGDLEGALSLLERGLAIAPNPPVVGRRPARLDLALDAAELLYAHPEVDPNGERFEALSGLLLFTGTEVGGGSMATHQRYHEVIGRLLGSHGHWTGDGADAAPYHLRLAIDLRRELDSSTLGDAAPKHPLPELSLLLAVGLVGAGDLHGALEAYLDAAEGFLAQGSRAEAEAALREAKALAAQLGGSQRAVAIEASMFGFATEDELKPIPIEALQTTEPELEHGSAGLVPWVFSFDSPRRARAFAPRSWYAGGGLGYALLAQSDGSVEGDLDEYDVDVDLDDGTVAYRLYAGYRFSLPLAIELGYTDLGQIDSTLGPEPASLSQFLDDLEDKHPAPGHGPSLALRGLIYGNDWFACSAKLGVWYWQADVDIETTAASFSFSEDGTDLFYGVDFRWQPFTWGGFRLELEQYGHDESDTNVATLGLEVELDRLFD